MGSGERDGDVWRGASGLGLLGAYGATLLIAAALGWLIMEAGGALVATQAPPPARRVSDSAHLWQIFAAIVAILAATRASGAVARRLGQPPVMGEIAAGIAMGPSLFGALWPQGAAWLLPETIAPPLSILSRLGVVLFMFLVGLEFNARSVRQSAHAAVAISHASILAPLLLGGVLALALYPRYAYTNTSFLAFALFVGVSMSVTAFPVLARILGDARATGTPLGSMAIACAAIDDVTAWCLLALVSGVAGGRPEGALVTLVASLVYIIAALTLLRPALRWLTAHHERAGAPLGHELFAALLGAVLASAALTDAIGVHALFGAFVVGALIPATSKLARDAELRIEALVHTLLLPLFFVFTGLRTQISLVEGVEGWLTVGLITLVATLGKFGGTFAAARLVRLPARDAGALGILMNTRGLMELIVLNVGLELGVLSPQLFTMMVLMALITTFATAPIFRWLRAGQ